MALPDFVDDVSFQGSPDGGLLVYVGGKVLGALRGFEGNGRLYVEMHPNVVAKIRRKSQSEG